MVNLIFISLNGIIANEKEGDSVMDDVILTYIQMRIFLMRIDEIRKANPYFNDPIVLSFETSAINTTAEIALHNLPIKFKIFERPYKYEISRSLFNYLTNLTGIDVFDKETIKEYQSVMEEGIKKAPEKILGKGYKLR